METPFTAKATQSCLTARMQAPHHSDAGPPSLIQEAHHAQSASLLRRGLGGAAQSASERGRALAFKKPPRCKRRFHGEPPLGCMLSTARASQPRPGQRGRAADDAQREASPETRATIQPARRDGPVGPAPGLPYGVSNAVPAGNQPC